MGIGRLDIARCGPCCCNIATDESSYEVCSGTWTPVSGGFETSDSDAKLLFLPEAIADSHWRVRCTVEVDGTGEFVARLHGGVLDCDEDDAYMELGRLSSGSDHLYWKLYNGQVPNDPAVCDASPGGLSSDVTYDMIFSWDGEYLTIVRESNLLEPVLSEYAVTPTGNGGRMGISTGTLGAGITAVRFLNILYEYVDKDGCDDAPAPNCCRGPVPPVLEFELTGLSGAICDEENGGGSLYGPCAIQCSVAEGSYFLDNGDCGEDCRWTSTGFSEVVYCENAFGTVVAVGGISGTITATITSMTIASVIRRVITVLVTFTGFDCSGGTHNGHVIELYAIIDEEHCHDWDDWKDLTPIEINAPTNKCGFGTYGSARIRKAA